ncbi:TetR family transcriptional regulator [Asanoa ferruginea]|uniref:TetR family transcriptional regulator n=1 Tax=Asanoa ferruginea TaxID=53367 RepID=A0A3D9ZWM2_9ACTN|nr:TetR/AcrR family transcriptional regulator [Asanoa ferruginea]REG01430.1 TetR family transcriptional regulator [Asanoa ferruginea]GIF47944.1 TetR family transcriptional regulator [Asanoa ferruginea]
MRSDSKPAGQRSGSFTEAARREQIVRGAVTVLAGKGYGGTSLQAIADHLGISKGVISYHFAGKAEVLHEVVRYVLAQAEAWMTPRVAAAGSFTAALRIYVTSNLAFLDNHRDEMVALTEVLANARSTPGVPELFGQSQHEAVAALQKLLEGGQQAGEFGAFSGRAAAVALRGAIDSSTGLMQQNAAFDVAAFSTELVDFFVKAARQR